MMTRHQADVRELAKPQSSTEQLIDHTHMSENDRRIAKEYLHQGELIADLICRAGVNLRTATELVSKSFARAKVSETNG